MGGCGRVYDFLGHETLKSDLSQEWIDEFSWFFPCWHKFMKSKSHFNNSWVGDRTLKNLLYLKNEFVNWIDFIPAGTNLWKLKVT